MDLVNLVNSEATVDLILKNPKTSAPLGIVFKVRHSDCRAVQMEAGKIREANIAATAGGASLSASAIERNQARLTAACIAGWDWQGMPFENGEMPVFSHDKATEVLLRLKWVKREVDKVADDIANFTAD